jgi:pre-mRNA-processing factor 19
LLITLFNNREVFYTTVFLGFRKERCSSRDRKAKAKSAGVFDSQSIAYNLLLFHHSFQPMLCSLSGLIPLEPVVSLKSGHLFEKRLILKYLDQNHHRCPITGDELDEKDLLTIQVTPVNGTSNTSSKVKDNNKNNLATFSPEAASIPQLLSVFQNEWDAVILETFTLKKHLDKTRQELSHALYQHDAACRVIARLNTENASLRANLTSRNGGHASNGTDIDMETAGIITGLTPEVIANIDSKQKELAKVRKDFKKKDGPARAELLEGLPSWSVNSTHTLHDSDKPGVLCVAIDPKKTGLVLTGGVDKNGKLFNTKTQQIEATLSGHNKKISSALFHPSAELVLTSSYDKTVKIWAPSKVSSAKVTYNAAHTFEGHEHAVSMVSLHPTGDYFLTGSLDGSWAFYDLRGGNRLLHTYLCEKASSDETLCVRFHPDGAIFGSGSKNRVVQMWDIKSQQNVATFEGHIGQVNTLSFSENGYHLASGSQDGVVKFWDLRKLKSFFELDFNTLTKSSKKNGPIHEVAFDPSGSYLAVASSNVVILKEAGKTAWDVVKTFDDHKAAVTGVKFSIDSTFLASSSMDRSLKIFK